MSEEISSSLWEYTHPITPDESQVFARRYHGDRGGNRSKHMWISTISRAQNGRFTNANKMIYRLENRTGVVQCTVPTPFFPTTSQSVVVLELVFGARPSKGKARHLLHKVDLSRAQNDVNICMCVVLVQCQNEKHGGS